MARTAPHDDGDDDGLVDQATFASLYDEALPRIYGYFYHRCDAAVAEDLTQETFLAAVAAIRSGQTLRAPLPWLFGIARNKLIDHYRRQNQGRRRNVISWDTWRDDGGLEPALDDSPWQEDGWRERTRRALAAIPESQRQALVLQYMDSLAVSEIAVALDRSQHAVESLLVRGRASFKRAYLEIGAGDDG